MREWWSKLKAAVFGRQDDLAEEMRAHFEMQAEDTSANQARREFGNVTRIAEQSRDAWSFPSLESFWKDIRFGFRAMRRSPGFALVVVLTFALGVGINTAIFSVVRQVLLKPLPYPAPERLVRFGEATGRAEGISVTWVNFQNWRAANHTFEEMAGFQFTNRTLTGRGDPLTTTGLTATAPYFPLLGMHPLLGRLFQASDDQPGAAPVVVLNPRFWQAQLGGDPGIVGATLTLNGSPFEVIGVAAPLWEPWKVDYYLPLGRILGEQTNRRQHGSMRMLGRLKPGVTLAQARADLDSVMRHLAETDPGTENDHRSYGAFWAADNTQEIRGTLLVLMAAAVLILLIACANVASLLLARNTARTGELALRKAIGAGRMRLVRQLLTENILLAGAGGLAGIAFAQSAIRILIALAPHEIPRLADTRIDVPVLLVACATTLLAGLLAGLAPVLMAGRVDTATALKEGSRSAGTGRRRQTLRNLLVIGEVALTFVLAFGSGLLLRSLLAAQMANPGFDPKGMLSFTLQLPGRSYKTSQSISDFYAGVLGDLRRIPEVTGASTVLCPPGAGDCGDWFYTVPGRPLPPQNEMPLALFNIAESGYFRVMRIPILQGREFTSDDRANGINVAVVNETFARTWWPHESALGHQVKIGGPYQEGDLLQIVGVSADVKQFELDTTPMPEVYRPFMQRVGGGMQIVVRTAGNPAALGSTIRRLVSARDRNLPVQHLGTMEEALGAGLARRRFSALLLSLFAGLAMLLAAIGIFGLLSYWVTSREAEIAIRLALGARPATILTWTSLHALRLAAIGLAFGTLGAWAAAGGLQTLVFGIPARNPAALAAAAAVVLLVSLSAAALPSWRASRVDAARRLQSS